MFFKGAFFIKFWPYVWLVFKSSFKSRASYSGMHTVLQNWTMCTNYRFHNKSGTNNQFQSISKQQRLQKWYLSKKSLQKKLVCMLVYKIQLLFCYIFFTPYPNCKNANIKYNSYFICLHICTALFLFFVYLN